MSASRRFPERWSAPTSAPARRLGAAFAVAQAAPRRGRRLTLDDEEDAKSMSRIIITDLTRFSNRDILCTAGIETQTGQCIRPMPYLQTSRCKELNLLPGAILTGKFTPSAEIAAPHIEDMNYQNLTYHGQCEAHEFRQVLAGSAYNSLSEGFDTDFEDRQKHIPAESAPPRSLITIRVEPFRLQVVQDQYDPKKVKAHITDRSGQQFSFLSITDLGLHIYAENHYKEAGNYTAVNNLLHAQQEVFVRVGLSRYHIAPNGKAGYWLQVNGIYSFPNYFETARRYD